jgi:FAD/FMN-containing dehydrogenase
MKRRQFLTRAAALPIVLSSCSGPSKPAGTSIDANTSRVRPGDPGWPSSANWNSLKDNVGGRVIEVKSPLAACRTDQSACAEVFRELKNPYYIGDNVALTQTSGWLDAWMSTPSVYAVAAAGPADIATAVNFARDHRLRLVIKGGGHSYLGTSNAPDSLLVWTRNLNDVAVHDAFVPQGCGGKVAPQPAVTVGAGSIWINVYDAVTTKGGRYVQGGGCATVGVSGFIQGGGFGSFSKNYGLGAAGLLEVEVITADGQVRIANACNNPDLFWALKGGGGGTFGVVSHVTLRTVALPENFGIVSGRIKASSGDAFRRLAQMVVGFYQQRLFNPQWGEQIRFNPDNTVEFHMVFQGLDSRQANNVWGPFLDSIASAPGDFSTEEAVAPTVIPAQHYWDADWLRANTPQRILRDDRTGSPAGNILWAGNLDETGAFLYGYRSAWLPAALLASDRQSALADALFAASRYRQVTLHVNKGLAGAPQAVRAEIRDTAINPAVVDAFALAIVGGGEEPAFPDISGHTPDVTTGRRVAAAINQAMAELLKLAPGAGSYLNESDFFESDWQQSFWGSNYARLASVKKQYDPDGLFFVHHGVGSEQWSADGFTRVGNR